MSGMCTEGIIPTDGQYGFVAFFGFCHRPSTTEDRSLPTIGLLPCTRVHSFGRNSQHGRFRYYDPNKLSGEPRVPLLARHTV